MQLIHAQAHVTQVAHATHPCSGTCHSGCSCNSSMLRHMSLRLFMQLTHAQAHVTQVAHATYPCSGTCHPSCSCNTPMLRHVTQVRVTCPCSVKLNHYDGLESCQLCSLQLSNLCNICLLNIFNVEAYKEYAHQLFVFHKMNFLITTLDNKL